VDVVVENPAGDSATSVSDEFTFNSGSSPTVSAVSPAWGDVAGGNYVTVTGTNFSGVTAVDFGGTAATSFTVLSSTVLVAQAPSSGSTGTVDITVTTYNATSGTGVDDHYFYDAAPTAVNDSYTATTATLLTVSTPGVQSNYSDPASLTMTMVLVSTTTHGTLSLASNGSFTYTSAGAYTGTDTFTYYDNDGYENSNIATVTITVGAPMLAAGGEKTPEVAETSGVLTQSGGAKTREKTPEVAETSGVLTQGELNTIVTAAIQRWAAVLNSTTVITSMEHESVTVANLSGAYLGLTTAQGILISSNAAGYGWYVDPTPAENEAFVAGGPPTPPTATGGE